MRERIEGSSPCPGSRSVLVIVFAVATYVSYACECVRDYAEPASGRTAEPISREEAPDPDSDSRDRVLAVVHSICASTGAEAVAVVNVRAHRGALDRISSLVDLQTFLGRSLESEVRLWCIYRHSLNTVWVARGKGRREANEKCAARVIGRATGDHVFAGPRPARLAALETLPTPHSQTVQGCR